MDIIIGSGSRYDSSDANPTVYRPSDRGMFTLPIQPVSLYFEVLGMFILVVMHKIVRGITGK